MPARLQIAFEYLKRGEPAQALPVASEAAKLAPDHFAACLALGQVLLETNDLQRAIPELEKAATLAPGSPQAHFMLARAYTRAGREADAARARAEFTRLDQIVRAMRQGSAVGRRHPNRGPRRRSPPLKTDASLAYAAAPRRKSRFTQREGAMSVARVTEITSSSSKSFDDALRAGLARRQQDAPERHRSLDQGSGSSGGERERSPNTVVRMKISFLRSRTRCWGHDTSRQRLLHDTHVEIPSLSEHADVDAG